MEELEQRLKVMESKLDEVLSVIKDAKFEDKEYSVSEVCRVLKIGRRRLENLIFKFHLNIPVGRVGKSEKKHYAKISYQQLKLIDKALKASKA